MNVARMLFREWRKEWKKDDVIRHAAAIAYYAVFSLPASLLVTLSIASATLDTDVVNDEVFATVARFAGERTSTFLSDTLENARLNAADSAWATYLGVILLIVAATGVIHELQKSVDHITGTTPKKSGFVKKSLNWFLSLTILLVTAAVIGAAIVSSTIIEIADKRVESLFSIPVDVLSIANGLVAYVALTIMIFISYLFLPSKRFPPLIALLSSIITGSVMITGTIVASYYVSVAGIGRAYGVAASVLILLFWIHFGATVFLAGAELMEVSDRLNNRAKIARFLNWKRLLLFKR